MYKLELKRFPVSYKIKLRIKKNPQFIFTTSNLRDVLFRKTLTYLYTFKNSEYFSHEKRLQINCALCFKYNVISV